jgi:hypothetical protein
MLSTGKSNGLADIIDGEYSAHYVGDGSSVAGAPCLNIAISDRSLTGPCLGLILAHGNNERRFLRLLCEPG